MPRVLTAAHRAINWDDPLTKGLIAHVTYPSSGRPIDLVRLGRLAYTGTLAYSGTASVFGTASDQPTASGVSGFSITDLCNRPATASAGSMLWIRRRYGSASESGFGCLTGGGTAFGGHFPWSDGNLYFDFGGKTAPNRVTISSPTFTADSVFIMTAGPAGMYVYQNGKLLGSSSTAVTRATSASDFGLSYGNGSINVNNRVDTLTIVAERQWTPDEVRQLTLDPFRLVEPTRGRRTVIILNSGASGVATQTIGAKTGTITLAGVPGAISASGSVAVGAKTGVITLTGVAGVVSPSGSAPIAAKTGTITLTGVPGAAAGSGSAPIGAVAKTITITGVPGSISLPASTDPNALKFTYRETGHTMTLRERGHTMTFRERA